MPYRPQLHPGKTLIEARIRPQAVPLRGNGEMDQPGVAYVEGALERFEGLVEISHLGVVHSFQSLDSIVNRIEWRSRTHFLALAAQTM